MPETTESKTEGTSAGAKKPEIENAKTKEEKPWWGELLSKVSGDNQLLTTLLKFILSPFGVLIMLGGGGYLLYKNLEYKKTILRIEEENKKLLDEKKSLEADHEELHEDFLEMEEHYLGLKNRQVLESANQQMPRLNSPVNGQNTFALPNKKRNQNLYLG